MADGKRGCRTERIFGQPDRFWQGATSTLGARLNATVVLHALPGNCPAAGIDDVGRDPAGSSLAGRTVPLLLCRCGRSSCADDARAFQGVDPPGPRTRTTVAAGAGAVAVI